MKRKINAAGARGDHRRRQLRIAVHGADLPRVRSAGHGRHDRRRAGERHGLWLQVRRLRRRRRCSNAVPNLDKLAVLTGEQVANIGSQDMSDEVWLKLAKRLNAVLADSGTDGGAHHPRHGHARGDGLFPDARDQERQAGRHGRLDAARDGHQCGRPGNIYNGVAVVADPGAKGKGALVVLERRDPLRPQRRQDRYDQRPDVCRASIAARPASCIPARSSGSSRWIARSAKPREFSVDDLDKLPRVDIIYAHANMSPDLIDAAVKNGAKGIVVAGVGDGNCTTPALDALSRAVKGGVVVVRSTRLASGIVLRNNEVNDDEKGFVASGELNPAKSRVLLQLALTKTTDPVRIQKMFYEY